ncbi:MAG TPA: tRNA (adenosine(37)-N6)-dimethylallyltransferase MiaA [Pirellulales bacterium]|jgi:tRNA dimethylallyltransferase|nr:tRNA (adenosine(37)-N6)-dimethylallyltransferase MiaA [Pirellulales bacterium]
MFDFAATCWFITGPTAGGKTSTGVELARRLGAEIVSLDSMAVYRGMDLGTAKPTVAEQAAAVHHLLDLVDPSDEYSVARYLLDAEQAVQSIQARGKQVLFVGGTPLYLKALLRGIFAGPPADWSFRESLQEFARTAGKAALHARLAGVDPAAAARLHVEDERRVIRALEVFEKTGRPISAWQAQFERGRPAAECRVFVLAWPRAELHARIERRVDEMFSAGLVDEVRAWLAGGGSYGRTASQAVGYREVLEHLRGERNLPATIALVKLRTRQFAKRQDTWFRSLSECHPLAIHERFAPAQVAERIMLAGQDADEEIAPKGAGFPPARE